MSFDDEVTARIAAQAANAPLREAAAAFLQASVPAQYSYNFAWAGRPIIQYPQDMVAMQELIWRVKPDLIVETGIAHGGSLMLSASMLALIDYCEASAAGTPLDPRASRRRVVGVDIDIRAHNRSAIEAHPLAHLIHMIQGSSVDAKVIDQVREASSGYRRVLVCLDSNHTHEHVLEELEAYAPLTSPGSYCCVFDTLIEDMPPDAYPDRPWGPGNNPKTAVREYLRRLASDGRRAADGSPLVLEIERRIPDQLLFTVAPDGYLKRPGP
ncbi:cephalosporin hydroxylase family protein [Caenimonas aquaedulcis]|uniref:Cephalosporin hydroxylase family protein n=1 Tax=Caenimonas aquaedulcis TaxID=2793270 RepID=A0A931H5K2_9BURK|nr:cephalosporin hydroxylase family protein [Caenimonas aquaedulcis]MBG9388882.1 cephalosporin hydroxylase family protein [Caenimonas aquaedulcis]